MKNGFLLIDKRSGPNSFKLVVAVRKLTGERSVGFAGTLDPLASGLMVMAVGEYTKLLAYLEAEDKVYLAGVRLGAVSDSYDAEGRITESGSGGVVPSREVVEKMIRDKFTGEIMQVPPRFSAIQVGGVRAYDMARSGKEFELKERRVVIYSCEVVRYEFPDLVLRVHCSKGTYIRSLAHDLGRELGCGGYIYSLRRERVGGLSVEDAVEVERLRAEGGEGSFVAVERVFSQAMFVDLSDGNYAVLARGNFVAAEKIFSGKGLAFNEDQLVLLGRYRGRVCGVLETCSNGRELKFKKKLNILPLN